jgi:hypothetical protein
VTGGRGARAGWLLVPLLLLFACVPLGAQEAGSRLRLETVDGLHTGIFIDRSADTLFLQHPVTRVRFSVPVHGVLFAQESMGRTPRTASVLRGALQTGAAGALFGVVMGLVMDGRRDAGPALFGAGVGAAVGASLALVEPARERWRPVEIGSAP